MLTKHYPRINKVLVSSFFGDLKQCFYFAPLIVISLYVYMGLRSTMIFPLDMELIKFDRSLWHLSYPGWYDILLVLSICISIIKGTIIIRKTTLTLVFVFSFIVLVSFFGGAGFNSGFMLDGFIYMLRFSLVFLLTASLVRSLSARVVESLMISIFFILAVSALVVYSLQFGIFNRIYASGMSVASFSQVAVVTSLVALVRKQKVVLIISLCFLFLTFSRTSILSFLLFLFIYFLSLDKIRFKTKIKYSLFILSFLTIATFLLINFGGPQFDFIISKRLNSEGVSNLSGRTLIWEYALEVVRNGNTSLFGVGFNAAPSLFAINNFTIIDGGRSYSPAHFHSIFLELGFGLGIFSLPIFFYLFNRVFKTMSHRCYPSFFIFAFFLLSQSVDFTFYKPKEVIIWALMLGLAEGQWQSEREQLRKVAYTRFEAWHKQPLSGVESFFPIQPKDELSTSG